MRKILILLFILLLNSNICYAQTTNETSQDTVSNQLVSQECQEINMFLNNYLKYSNTHDIENLQKLYADNYFSGDGLNKEQLTNLMKDTWKNYPDIKYSSIIKAIRINDNLATVESFDIASGETSKKSDITNDIGLLNSDSHNILYLQRYGKTWKIISDHITYEKTTIKYGSAKNTNVDFYVPEQVNSGENYTASLHVSIPNNVICLGSITREPIVYPQTKQEEVFRQIQPDVGELERVMKANTNNNNELISASAGFTEIVQDKNISTDIRLTGIAVIMQRVNIVPKSTYVQEAEKTKVYNDRDQENLPNKQGQK